MANNIALATLDQLTHNTYMEIYSDGKSVSICPCPEMIPDHMIISGCDCDYNNYFQRIQNTEQVKKYIEQFKNIILVSIHSYDSTVVEYVYDNSAKNPTEKSSIDWTPEKEAYLMMLCGGDC
jgi:hypothetical protein